MGYLYHGSAIAGIRSLEARSALHGTDEKVVYLTDNVPYALFYIWDKRITGYGGKHVTGWVKGGKAYYEEQFPDQLKRFYQGASGWLYRVPKDGHIHRVERREGLFYAAGNTAVEAEYIPDVYGALLEHEAAGALKVLRYTQQTRQRQDELTGLMAEVILQAHFFQSDPPQQAFMKLYFSNAWKLAQTQHKAHAQGVSS